MIALGAGTVTGASKLLGENFFLSDLVLQFAPNDTAIGFNFLLASGPGNPVNGNVTFTFFDASNTLFGTTVVSTSGGIPFFGVTSTVPISSIRLSGGTDSKFVDNVAFGNALAPTAAPEFGSVFSLGGLLAAGGAGLWLRRGRARQHNG